MPRPHRIEYEGAWHHVINRGVAQQPIFENDADRRLFLRLLCDASSDHGVEIHGYCLMGNHYHLLMCTPHANLGTAMKALSERYTQAYNRKYGRDGPLFRGRSWSTRTPISCRSTATFI